MKPITILGIFIALSVLLNAIFIVDQREQVLVLQLGKVDRVIQKPGLYFKIPMVQNLKRFDNRVLDLNAKPRQINLSGQKRLVVDAFIKYRITDPLKFYQAEQVPGAIRSLLDTFLDSNLRQVMASAPLTVILTGDRQVLMNNIRDNISTKAADLGVEVVDVRIMRADFPKENSETVYREMRTDREKEAKELRAKGQEVALEIRAQADKERTITIANAEKTSQIIRGEGDAEATKIFADAYNRDAEFFDLYRTLQAYRNTLDKDNTQMVLSPDSEFMKYFGSIKP